MIYKSLFSSELSNYSSILEFVSCIPMVHSWSLLIILYFLSY